MVGGVPERSALERREGGNPGEAGDARRPVLVALDGIEVVGSITAGYDGHRGWLYAAAVRQSHRRGAGSMLVRNAEGRLQSKGCGKVNLQIRASNAAVASLYQAPGYGVEDRISPGKRVTPRAAMSPRPNFGGRASGLPQPDGTKNCP